MTKQSNWLILSHGFNMDGRAASQTITDKIPFLIKEGINPVIISAITGNKDSIVPHYQVFPMGGAGLRFDLRHYFKQKIKSKFIYKIIISFTSITLLPFIVIEKLLFGLQSQASWSIPAFFTSLFLIKKYQINLIYSTGGAYSAHLSAYWLKKILGINWICEIHDPMVRPGHIPKTRDEKFQKNLESKICQKADLIWWFTDGALKSAQQRNPILKDKGVMIIPGASPPNMTGQYFKNKTLNICHFGSLSESRSLSTFLEALSFCIRSNMVPDNVFKLHIYGGSLDQKSKTTIKVFKLEQSVIQHGRLEFDAIKKHSGREQVLLKMQEADCLLLIHGEIPECSEYIPSKLYEYFWAKRPIFGITHNNIQLDRLITQRNGFVAHSLDFNSIHNQIECLYQSWSSNNLLTHNSTIGVDQAVTEIISNCHQRNLMQ
jgi:hypothetical protein